MIRFFKYFILICLFVHIGLGQTTRAAGDTGIDLVRLQTDDGIILTGILRKPRMPKSNTCVVLIHGYSGNFYSGIMEFLPEALTDRGYTTLAINMRDHDRDPKSSRFEENRYDIAVAVNKMAQLDCKSIFLYGHSMGTNRVLYYLAATQDPRIKGVLLTGPPGNLFEWNASLFGPETANKVLRQAQDLVAGGKGDQWMLMNLGPLGKALYTANHVVSLRGPESVSDPYKNISRISKPILIVHGLDDRLANPDMADRLKNSAPPKTNVSVIKIPGANHRFNNHQQDLVNAMCQWLIKQMDAS
ncbi:MAG: alpha/beta fold hydrolase [Desulfobacterales bacterium]